MAFQTLSNTVYSAMYTHATANPPTLPLDAICTADVVLIFNNLGDSINGSTIRSGNKYKCAITDNSVHMDYYAEMIDWLSRLKIFNSKGKDVTNQMKFISGWQITLSSFIGLWNHLHSNCDFNFLLPRRLNQDPLENLFSTLRRKGGSCDNPTPLTFGRLFRQSLSSELIKVCSSSNCEDDDDSFLVLLGDVDCNDHINTASRNDTLETLSSSNNPDPYVDSELIDWYNDNSITVGEGNGSNSYLAM